MATSNGKHAADPATKINRILIVFAMKAEAQPFVERMGLTLDQQLLPPPLPCLAYSGMYNGGRVFAVCNGPDPNHNVDSVGTVSAALTTYAALHSLRPDVVITAGTAGGFHARGAAIGDIFLATSFRHHDRRIPLPGFDLYGHGQVDAFSSPKLASCLNLKLGVVSSGNSLDCCTEDAAILETNQASVKEMEGAAVAYVARLFGIPAIGVKSITDIVDGGRPTGEEFMDNLAKAAAALQVKLPLLIQALMGKTFGEL